MIATYHKDHAFVLLVLRTERKVRIALDWIADEIIGKNNKNTMHKNV